MTNSPIDLKLGGVKNLILSLAFLVAFQAKATLFHDLNRAFDLGIVPSSQLTRGYWAGYCAHHNRPEDAIASVYIYKNLKHPKVLPYPYDSQTYYLKHKVKENYYHFFTPEKLEKEPDIKRWYGMEHWGPAHVMSGSFANHFRHPTFDSTRMVRVYPVAGKKNLVLKVVPFNSPEAAPFTLCFYPDFLGDLPAAPPTEVTPFPVLAFKFGHTGKIVKEKDVEFKLESIKFANQLFFYHEGKDPVELEEIEATLPNATLYLAEKLVLKPKELTPLLIGSPGEDLVSLSFTVKGNSDDIEVRGFLDSSIVIKPRMIP